MNGKQAVLYRIKKEFLVKKKLNLSILGAGSSLAFCPHVDEVMLQVILQAFGNVSF